MGQDFSSGVLRLVAGGPWWCLCRGPLETGFVREGKSAVRAVRLGTRWQGSPHESRMCLFKQTDTNMKSTSCMLLLRNFKIVISQFMLLLSNFHQLSQNQLGDLCRVC